MACESFRKKLGEIDLGKGLSPAGAWRPFQFEGIGMEDEIRWEIAFNGPCMNGLAAVLFDHTRRVVIALWRKA